MLKTGLAPMPGRHRNLAKIVVCKTFKSRPRLSSLMTHNTVAVALGLAGWALIVVLALTMEAGSANGALHTTCTAVLVVVLLILQFSPNCKPQIPLARLLTPSKLGSTIHLITSPVHSTVGQTCCQLHYTCQAVRQRYSQAPPDGIPIMSSGNDSQPDIQTV